jgi:uncharacterized Tic20 family protein
MRKPTAVLISLVLVLSLLLFAPFMIWSYWIDKNNVVDFHGKIQELEYIAALKAANVWWVMDRLLVEFYILEGKEKRATTETERQLIYMEMEELLLVMVEVEKDIRKIDRTLETDYSPFLDFYRHKVPRSI